MNLDITFFRRVGSIYPQPIALSCGRICRARTDQERLDAILKCAEILTRYLAALAISSFCAQDHQETRVPDALKNISGNLSFGHFLAVVRSIALMDDEHPLKAYLGAGFRGGQGEPGVADTALTALLNLRNSLGHDLMSLSEAKVAAVFAEYQPEEKLIAAMESLIGLLNRST
jgi:hypothetical protein